MIKVTEFINQGSERSKGTAQLICFLKEVFIAKREKRREKGQLGIKAENLES